MKAVGIELGTIEMKNLNSVVKSSGQLEVPPQNKADVNSLVPGIIKKIMVLEGSYVRQGQTLAVLENTDIVRMQQDYLTLKKEFVYTHDRYQKAESPMYMGGLIKEVIFQSLKALLLFLQHINQVHLI